MAAPRGKNSKVQEPEKVTFTITYGEVAENHIGQQQIGIENANGIQRGLNKEQLLDIEAHFKGLGAKTELVDLCQFAHGTEIEAHPELDEACVLVVHNGVSAILEEIEKNADDMFRELNGFEWDAKFYSKKHGRVVNKNARSNLCFNDESQEANFEDGKGTIVGFEDVPCVNQIREVLIDLITSPETDVSNKVLKAEGNRYVGSQGIGFHGDTERKIVVAVRLGEMIPLHYQWFYKTKPIGERCILTLNHGDIYFMSSKAVGNDWKRRIIPTLRHAAGSDKYTKITPKKNVEAASKSQVSEGSVKNPITKRTIKISGAVYKKLIAQGYTLVKNADGEFVLKHKDANNNENNSE